MKKYKNLKNNEQGIVSMIIVIFVILLLTLIVLAMSRNANREQRQALDRQLSSQAYYAAESGINDVADYVVRSKGTPGFREESTDCATLPGKNKQINALGPVEYTCILYDASPDSLEFGPVDTSSAEITPIIPKVAGGELANLNIYWDQTGGNGNMTNCKNKSVSEFPTINNYLTDTNTNPCSAGVLRVELIDARNLNRDTLAENDFVAFLVPGERAGPTIAYSSARGADGGRVVSAECSDGGTPRKCHATITGIGLKSGERMYLKLRSLYTNNNVVVTGVSNNPGQAVEFENAQLKVDSTGKANDVLKRLQVRIPLTAQYALPDFVIQTADSICKRIAVTGTSSTDVQVESPCRAP